MRSFPALTLLALGLIPMSLGAQITNHEAPGNLESKHALGCIALDAASNQYTPADLYPAAATCIRENKHGQAAELYTLGNAFGRFDIARVTDRSAHQALQVLQMQAFGEVSEEQAEKVSEALKTKLGDATELKRLCTQLQQLGAPAYHPTYMLQHGMGAFLSDGGPSKALAEDFDPKAAWNEVLTSFVKCS